MSAQDAAWMGSDTHLQIEVCDCPGCTLQGLWSCTGIYAGGK